MSLSKVLNKYYGGRWDSFASPTDTIADYDNIRWIGDAASKEEISARIEEHIAEETANGYKRDRATAYPSIQDQLDMQYWDSINGTTTWADAIAAVKAAHPKP